MTSSASADQMKILIEFMGQHLDLARNRLQRSIEGRTKAKNLWLDVTNLLSAVGGSVKSTKQWQKVWSDKKYIAKKNSAAASRSAKGTGGGPSNTYVTRQDHLILNIMGEGYGLLDTEAITNPFPRACVESNNDESPGNMDHHQEHNSGEESDDSLQIFDNPSTGHSQRPSFTDAAQQVVPLPEPNDDMRIPTVCASISSTPLVEPSEGRIPSVSASIPSIQRGRRRGLRLPRTPRPQALSEDVRTRLFRIEEKKIEELAAIRAQFEKLTDVVTAALEEMRRVNNNTGQ